MHRLTSLGVLMAILLTTLPGCGAGVGGIIGGPTGDLRIQSLGVEPVALSGRFNDVVYANGEAVEWSFLLSDVEPAALMDGSATNGRVIHIELLWIPRPGMTPIEITATNASVRYVIISEGQVGVYGGAGFAKLRGKPGDSRVTLSLRDASLRLLHSTDGFADLLTPAQLSGTVTASRNTRKARIIHHAASQFVTDALGHSIIVQGSVEDTWTASGDIIFLTHQMP
jgi:hypothetical protein